MVLKSKSSENFILPREPGILKLERRLFMKQALSLGALTLLSGCDATEPSAQDRILNAMSSWNDKAQGFIFSSDRLAPVYTVADIKDPFPFNAFYSEGESPEVAEADYKLQLSGMISDKTPWSLEQLRALPQQSQITRHICVEGWSAIGKWGGAPLGDYLRKIGADTSAKYVGFKCADDYFTSLDMATALHPQTIMAFTFRDQVLPQKYGFPFKVRVPTKLGFKNPKHVMEMFVTNDYPGGYWEDQGYNWFSGT